MKDKIIKIIMAKIAFNNEMIQYFIDKDDDLAAEYIRARDQLKELIFQILEGVTDENISQ